MASDSKHRNGLRGLWAAVLKIEPEKIVSDSHFFHLGADSVAVIRLWNRAPEFDLQIEPSTIYSRPIFEDMLTGCSEIDASAAEPENAGQDRLSSDRLKTWAARQCNVEEEDVGTVQRCTPLQRDFMQSHLESGGYFFQTVFRLEGPLGHFYRAWNTILKQNPILRTRLVQDERDMYQVTVKEDTLWTHIHDFASYKEKDRARGMKLGRPLSRQAIVHDGDQIMFCWSVHHAIQDGWTRRLMYSDLIASFTDHHAFLLEPVRPAFSVYTEFLEVMGEVRALKHWEDLLHGLDRFDMLYPPAWDKPQIASASISKLFAVPKPTNILIGQAALAHAAWSLVLSVVSGASDIFFASDRSGRACGLKGVDNIMGAMLATVPFRLQLDSQKSINHLLHATQEQIIAGIPYEAWGRAALWKHFGHNKYLQSNLLPQLKDPDLLYDSISVVGQEGKMVLTPLERHVTACEVGLLLSSYPKGEGQQYIVADFDENLISYDRMNAILDLYGHVLSKLSQEASSKEPLDGLLKQLSQTHAALADVSVSKSYTSPTKVNSLFDLIDGSSANALVVLQRRSISLTYSHLKSLILQAKQALVDVGVRKGDTVSLAAPNGLEFVILFFAVSSIGSVVAPLNPRYRKDEFSFYLKSAASVLLIVARDNSLGFKEATQAAQEEGIPTAEIYTDGTDLELKVVSKDHLEPSSQDSSADQLLLNDVALLLYTSGTTGTPKAVPLTHDNLINGALTVRKTYNLNSADRPLLVMPLFHIHGIVAGLLAPLAACNVVTISSSVTPDFWQLATRNHITWFTCTPTMHKMVTQLPQPKTKPKLRFVRSCSSPLSPTLLSELEKMYDAPVLEAYAMTEASHQMTSNLLDREQGRLVGSVGKPTGKLELLVLDDEGHEVGENAPGEICIRGPSVMKGYLDNAAANQKAFTRDGFLRTGDQGLQTPEGFIRITGRIKELINKGGEKISPIEIDNILSKHEAVSEAVSFAVPDDMYGETIGAAIILHDTHRTVVGGDELKKWMGESVAAFKVPTKIYFPDNLPRTATGKLQRLLVAKQMLQSE